MYGFNPLTPLDLLPLPVDERTSLDGKHKAELVKQLHEKVKQNIEKRTEQYVKQANKGRKKVVFQPGDWVWVHMRKERFPEQRRSKLHPRGDGPFQVLERFGDNAYRLDLPGEYNVSATFNVSDLSLFDDADLRANPSQERGDDEGIVTAPIYPNDPLRLPIGPVTRSRAKKRQQTLIGFMEELWIKSSVMEAEWIKEGARRFVTLLQHTTPTAQEISDCN